MSQQTTEPKLGDAFAEALNFAAEKHRAQVRKGGDIPYLGHLLSVAGLVIEAGGSETEAIAALLHDAAEDAGGEATLTEIRNTFGDAVADIVAACSDTFETPKPPWKQRKQAYIDHVGDASAGAVLVSLADKLDNARAIVRDLRREGDGLWERFSVNDPGEHLWYYRSLLATFEQRRPHCWMVADLKRVIEAWSAELKPASTTSG
jgi:(p)ppGpp synthase/HD superfamily hydrolase